MRRKKDNGVTLIELCFGLAVVAILAGLAVPGFRASLRAAAVRSAAYELMAGVQVARAGSITESRPGVLCPSDSSGRCLAAGVAARHWATWLEDGVATRDRTLHALPAGVTLRSSRAPLRFWPLSLSATTGTLTICDAFAVATPRAIVISQSGRPRFASPTAGECA
jgi:type IV fimbrial biogenesis protein FimT